MTETPATQTVCFFDGPPDESEPVIDDEDGTSAEPAIDEECPSADEHAAFKSAGIIPFNDDGIWLGRMAKCRALADFGGKREGGETAWATASRECREESGLVFESHSLDPATHPRKRHITFMVHTTSEPIAASDEIEGVQHIEWKYIDVGKYHARLKYDHGGVLRNLIKRAKASVTPESAPAPAAAQPTAPFNDDPRPVHVDTTYVVPDEERPTVLVLREDIDDMRAAYWLASLSLEGYVQQLPERKKKCDKEERDFSDEFDLLQSWLKRILGKEGVQREYAHSEGKDVGRLFSSGLQNAWSEVRGLLNKLSTDIDMQNCHPRILIWICTQHGIECAELVLFVEDREVYYAAIMEATGRSRDEAKAMVLQMMNDADEVDPFGTMALPECVLRLDREFKRLQREVTALPCYAPFEQHAAAYKIKGTHGRTWKKYNKVGSWLNLVLCHHENAFVLSTRDYLWSEHAIETKLLSFDGLLVYGDHYSNGALLDELASNLKAAFGVDMPFAYKEHSSLLQVPPEFQVYPIDEKAYISNIGDQFLRDASDFARIVAALRSEYELRPADGRANYKAAAQSLLARSKRAQETFATYWETRELRFNAEVLKHYSRATDEWRHIFNVRQELGIRAKTTFAEAELRDFFLAAFGDDLMSLKDEKQIFLWHNMRWRRDDGQICEHVIMEKVRRLFVSIAEFWNKVYKALMSPDECEVPDGIDARACRSMDPQFVGDRIEEIAATLKRYGAIQNRNVRILVVNSLRAAALEDSPFDKREYLFAFTNRTYDMRARRFVTPSKYDYILMNCGKPWVQPTPAQLRKVAELYEVTLPDADVRKAFVSVLRSALVGILIEKFIVLTGTGRNGKGMLMSNFRNVAGEYATKGHISILTRPRKEGPSPEWAALENKRCVMFSEPEEGNTEPLRLSNIKELTGDTEQTGRACHSNRAKFHTFVTTIMECNTQPVCTGTKEDAAQERLRMFLFRMTFTDDAEKLAAQPDKYRPVDPTLKAHTFMEEHRCAFFLHIATHGTDEIDFPECTKAAAQKYLEENDDLSIWFLDAYEKCETQPPKHFVSVKDMYREFEASNMYQLMSAREKKRFNQTKFIQDVTSNMMLKKYYREIGKVSLLRSDGKMKQTTRAGVVHWRRKMVEPDYDE